MTQHALAVYEQGTLKLLGPVSLTEQQQVRVEITVVDESDSTNAEAATVEDPLAHIRIQTGISDLAEHFDDYRFGLRKPGVQSSSTRPGCWRSSMMTTIGISLCRRGLAGTHQNPPQTHHDIARAGRVW